MDEIPAPARKKVVVGVDRHILPLAKKTKTKKLAGFSTASAFMLNKHKQAPRQTKQKKTAFLFVLANAITTHNTRARPAGPESRKPKGESGKQSFRVSRRRVGQRARARRSRP
jgi:hypothetical protein